VILEHEVFKKLNYKSMALPEWVPGMVYPGGPYYNGTIPWKYYPPVNTGDIECMQVIEDWGPVQVVMPAMVLIAGIGAMTGCIGFRIINFSSKPYMFRDIYRLPFFWFAFMNTTGIICNCFLVTHSWSHPVWPPDTAGDWFAFFDGGCSTCCSLSFALAALSDWGILKWKRASSKIFILASYAFVWGGYVRYRKGHWENGLVFLYKDVTQYATVFYTLSTVLWLFIESCKRKKLMVVPLVFLVLGQGLGLFGLNTVASTKGQSFLGWLCGTIGPNFGFHEVFWYECSDSGLFFLLLSYLTSHEKPEENERPGTEERLLDSMLLDSELRHSTKTFSIVV